MYLEMIMTSTDLNLMVFLTKIMRQNVVFLYTECYELYYNYIYALHLYVKCIFVCVFLSNLD